MRIIAGEFGGRIIRAPKGSRTRPMSERMRSALFNSLGDITNLEVLDAYGGSGSLALESLSRGAKRADICETDLRARKILESNIEVLNLEDRAKLHKANCATWVKATKKSFDIIFADPPYDRLNYDHLELFSKFLNHDGLLVVSHPKDYEFDTSLRELDTRSFAAGNLSFYKQR